MNANSRLSSFAVLLLAVAVLSLAAGCPRRPADAPRPGNHHHDHSHDEGPEGGHVIELGDHEYHVEWLHDDKDDRLTFIVRDADIKEEVRIDADHLAIELTTTGPDGEEVTRQVEAVAVGRTDEDPTTARFELVDKGAIANILHGEGVTAVLHVPIGDKAFTAEIEHDHHGHGHSH